MNSDWLTARTNLAAEMRDTYAQDLRKDWERLLAKLRSGDELWRFASPTAQDSQIGGVALVRSGQVISEIVYWAR